MYQVFTSIHRHPINTGSEKLAREYFEAAKRSGMGAELIKDGVVIAECDVFSE